MKKFVRRIAEDDNFGTKNMLTTQQWIDSLDEHYVMFEPNRIDLNQNSLQTSITDFSTFVVDAVSK